MADVMTFGAVFDAIGTAVDSTQPALLHGDDTVSWGDLDRSTTALAAAFHAAGAVPGDRIAHLMRNSPAYMATCIGGFRARLVHVNVNYRYTGEELFYILDNSGATVVVYDAEFAPLIASIRHRLDVKLYLQVGGEPDAFAQSFEAMANSGATLPAQDHQYDDMLFIYTGGTTGMPKGVMWDQGAMWELVNAGVAMGADKATTVAQHLAAVAAVAVPRRSLVLPPLMHGTGFLIALNTLALGGTVITLPGSGFDPVAAVEACARHGCDYMVLVGDAFARPLLRALDDGHGSIATARTIISSGTMWSPEVKAGLLRHAPDCVLLDALSSSEGLGMGVSAQTKENAGAATKFMRDPLTLVLDEDMKPVEPGSGRMGKLARGGHVPRGYWRDEAKSAATFVMVDGVRYSIPGDWAIVEADGSFTLLGRGSQCINTAGEKVFPEEVEEMLKTHPAVTDALVFGIPDETWGQAVTAVVESADAVDGDELRAHVRASLAGYKTPKRVLVVAKVPRAPNGKADYAAAKAMLG